MAEAPAFLVPEVSMFFLLFVPDDSLEDFLPSLFFELLYCHVVSYTEKEDIHND